MKHKHITAFWFERASRLRDRKGSPSLDHVLVVETDLLNDMTMLDTGDLDDLDHALREHYDHREEIRFVPPGHYARASK